MSRRSTMWIVLGLTWVAMGFHVLFEPEMPRPWLLHTLLGPIVRSGLWIVAGLLAASLAAFTGRGMPSWADRTAVFALTIPPVIRLSSYGIDLAWAITPPNPPGEWFVAGDFFLWLGLVLALWGVARWPDDNTEGSEDDQLVG